MKTGAPLLETPFSVTVIPRGRIEEQRAQSLNEVLRYAPGVQSEQYGGLDQAYDFLTIRGFGGPSFDGLFRDGLQLYTFGFTGFRVEPYGAEAIEVLRGAATVLYGQTGPGGLVNVVSKRPPAAPLRELTLEGGNFDHLEGRADFGGPLGTGGWRYRITGLVRNSDTQVDFEPNDRVFVAPALSWSGARTSFTFLGQYQSDSAGHFQFLPQTGTLDPSPNGRIPETRADGEPAFDAFDRRQYSAGYVFERRLSERVRLRQRGSFDHVDVDYQDVFGTGLDPGDPSQRSLTRATFTILGDTDVISVDSQALADVQTGGVSHAILAGLDYQHSTFDSVDGFGEAPPLDVFTPTYGAPIVRPSPYADAQTRQGQVGVYAQDRVRLPGGLVALLAGRQNFVSADIEDRLAATTTDEDTDKFVWQGGLVFTNRAGLVPHFSYSESFQPVPGRDASDRAYQPQTGRQYELGLRYQPPAHSLALSVAAFDLRRQNVLTSDPTNPANQIQTGEVASRGLEFEAESAFGPGWRLNAAYCYQDVEITKSNDGDVGLRPEAIPAHLASLWVHHDIRSGSLAGLEAGAGVRYQGATLDETNTVEVDGFTLVDAVLGYGRGPVRVALNAQNLLDTEHVAGCAYGNCYYGRSRTVYASATFSW
jgi:iron complex outermembrane receptor protein